MSIMAYSRPVKVYVYIKKTKNPKNNQKKRGLHSSWSLQRATYLPTWAYQTPYVYLGDIGKGTTLKDSVQF